jgi:hypothetical protein
VADIGAGTGAFATYPSVEQTCLAFAAAGFHQEADAATPRPEPRSNWLDLLVLR